MKIQQHFVIRLEYTLRINGEIVDYTERPMTILTGFARDLPKGLEAELIGKIPGEYKVTVPPERAYGPYDPKLRLEAKVSDLPETPKVGDAFTADAPNGESLLYRVILVDGEDVVLDGNPQWAGKVLEYDFTIHSVRPAELEEAAHGHVHGEGGVHH
ncbi:MAG: peptidylprolyl isomerase [Meiothermus sp.]